jgi:hypothetical protein
MEMQLTKYPNRTKYPEDLQGYGVGYNGLIFGRSGMFLKYRNKNGYNTVGLQINKKKKMFFVHRLVAEYFVAPKRGNLQVNHIDGNKQNNDFRNLEWVTPSQNTKHAYDNGLNKNVILAIKKANSKQVCDMSNGILYDSAKDAAICKRINYGTLRNKLNGHDKNNTTLKYI